MDLHVGTWVCHLAGRAFVSAHLKEAWWWCMLKVSVRSPAAPFHHRFPAGRRLCSFTASLVRRWSSSLPVGRCWTQNATNRTCFDDTPQSHQSPPISLTILSELLLDAAPHVGRWVAPERGDRPAADRHAAVLANRQTQSNIFVGITTCSPRRGKRRR